MLSQTLGKRGREGRVLVSKDVRQWGGQAAIMMWGYDGDGGWNGGDGDGSLKSIFKQIWAVNMDFDHFFGRKFRLPVIKIKVCVGGEWLWSTVVDTRLSWFMWTILTHCAELSYRFLCLKITNYILCENSRVAFHGVTSHIFGNGISLVSDVTSSVFGGQYY